MTGLGPVRSSLRRRWLEALLLILLAGCGGVAGGDTVEEKRSTLESPLMARSTAPSTAPSAALSAAPSAEPVPDPLPTSRAVALPSVDRLLASLTGVLEPEDSIAVLDLERQTLIFTRYERGLKLPSHPGSVMKLLTAATMLEQGLPDRGTFCRGSADARSGKRCWTEAGHGVMHLGKALALSCNRYFEDVAERLEPSRFLSVLSTYGLDRTTGWLPGEEIQPLPSSLTQEALQKAALGGGHEVMPTGLQLLRLAAILSGAEPYGSYGGPHDEVIRQGMRDAVSFGTAGPNPLEVAWAAKTGTAPEPSGWRYQGWCIGYTPAVAPHFAFVVHRSQGVGSDAAHIAWRVVAWLQNSAWLEEEFK